MAIYEVDPLRDVRWPQLLERDRRASVFHTPAWLEALRRSYGYTPVVLTTCPPRRNLTNGMVFCRVNSWLTGHRLVSLPFSDHCDLLLNQPEETAELTSFLGQMVCQERLKYVEIRPFVAFESQMGFREGESFCFHSLDLRPTCEELFRNLHKNCIQRKIRRARREGLKYERANNGELVKKFYPLFAMTRKRHGLPPPPISWLYNLLECLGDKAEIRLASKGSEAAAGMLTITHKDTVIYKYGGSNPRFHNLGGTAFLFWKTITEAKARGIEKLDLGRCDTKNEGLIRYKDRLGCTRSTLTYWRMPLASFPALHYGWKLRMAKRLFTYSPALLRIQLGNRLYKHAG
jgi:hypothetical protein